jgi:hypothetical protein
MTALQRLTLVLATAAGLWLLPRPRGVAAGPALSWNAECGLSHVAPAKP